MKGIGLMRLGAALLALTVSGAAPAATPAVPEAAARHAVERLRAEALVAPPAPDRRGHLVRRLAALGPAATPALLDALRADGALGRADDPARRLFAAAVAEAVAQARLPEAAPVFRAILAGEGDDPRIARAAAAGLGRLCGDEEVRFLASLSAPGGRRAEAAVAGLGYCRRAPAALALRARLGAAPDAGVARALGSLGSSWAWEALGPDRRAEGDALRSAIARDLVAALPGSEGELRTELGRALLTVQAPETPALLAAAKARNPADAAALDELAARFTGIRGR